MTIRLNLKIVRSISIAVLQVLGAGTTAASELSLTLQEKLSLGDSINSPYQWNTQATDLRLALSLKSGIGEMGLSAPELQTRPLDQLKDIASDIGRVEAIEIAGQWRNSSPTSFYAAMAGGAASVGAYGYIEGSEVLKQLGINPKLKKNFFDDHLTLIAQPYWESLLKDGGMEGVIEIRWEPSNAGQIIDGAVSFSYQGVRDMSLTYQLKKSAENHSLYAYARYSVQTDHAQAGLAMLYQPSENMAIELSSSIDNHAQSQLGIDFIWKF